MTHAEPVITECTVNRAAALVPAPHAHANKYSRGKVALVAGSAAYPGAACLAASAALRSGAGYAQVVCAPQSVPVVQAFRPSVVASAWDALDAESAVAKAQAVCLGPGLDVADDMSVAVALVTLNSWAAPDVPALIDGGALGVVATPDGRRALRNRVAQGAPTVLTPHGGEAARLAKPLGLALPTGPEDEPAQARLAQELARYYGSVVVLKGPITFISNGEAVFRMGLGTPALAKAGTGDVLAGMISACLAQGLESLDAALLGAVWHALAGTAAAQRLTDVCVCAEDVIDSIPEAVKTLQEA
ncbi:MAG: NAD(P)H-hydrate dehydratase [Coriobacteriia bacterium]|nr:NAD(P)H-hydrate dehydratase [Coriobacteriia bacterium]